MRCIWQMDGDKVKGFKCEFSPVDMLMIVSGLKYIVADIERHPKDRERAQGIYNQIMLCRYYDEADRKTEPQSVTYNPTSVNNIWEKPTNPYVPNEQTEPTISKMEQVDKDDAYFLELMGAVERGEISDAGANQAWYEYINHKDEPQTCDDCIWSVCNYNKAFEDEPQTDCPWAKPLPEFNCKECKWWSPITKTCHYDGFPCKYEPIPII